LLLYTIHIVIFIIHVIVTSYLNQRSVSDSIGKLDLELKV